MQAMLQLYLNKIMVEQQTDIVKRLLGTNAIIDQGSTINVTLKHEEAKIRAMLVSEIEYDFQLALNKGDYYIGKAVINFYLQAKPEPHQLFLDFNAIAITDFYINDTQIQDVNCFQDSRVQLQWPNVQIGWNTIQLRYLSKYNQNRVGLHSYIDNSDQNQYLYTQFEAFHCNKVFPVFDQPDLKAKMTLVVTCPQEWKTVSNSIERRFEQAIVQGKFLLERHGIESFLSLYTDITKVSLYEFEQTPKIPTYLFAICAGNYKVIEDFDGMYPQQRIYVRQSLADNLRAQLVFTVTKTTINFYQKNFGIRYPFSKVDHVMCPDFKHGAMENVGCITYSDALICGSKHMSVPQLTFMVVVIQHELCHMWFGNLVTMKWWDDLWLNEAFATALSYKACSMGGVSVDDFQDEAWIHLSGYKRWGLAEDLMPSNHKIQAECLSTDTAESLIDGITYGKGSAIIKQLIYIMGWDTFTSGLKIYFQKFKWQNTTLPDFIESLQQGYDQSSPQYPLDLTQWAHDWIQTKGSNRIAAEYSDQNGKITQFKLRQTPCKYGDTVYRKQNFNIALYDEEGNLIEKVKNVQLGSSELTQVQTMIGKDLPAAFLLNSDDWGFGYFELDLASVKVFEESLCKVKDSLDRAVIISNVIAMMRQLTYPATRMPIIMNQLLNEDNQNLINALFGAFVLAQQVYLPPETVPRFNKEVAQFFFRKAKQDKGNDQLQIFCLEKAITFVTEKDHLKLCSDWIHTGKLIFQGEHIKVELTQPQKYQIIKSYYASTYFSLDDKKALKEKALQGDLSDEAQLVSKICDWSLPDTQLKQALWEEITDPTSKESLKDISLKIQGFWQRKQQLELITPFFDRYYSILEHVVETRDREFAELFMNSLSPAFMARESDEKQFQSQLDKCSGDKEYFALFLKKQLEIIDVTKKSRYLCENYKMD